MHYQNYMHKLNNVYAINQRPVTTIFFKLTDIQSIIILHYTQPNCLPMRSQLSPILSDLFMKKFENKYLLHFIDFLFGFLHH